MNHDYWKWPYYDYREYKIFPRLNLSEFYSQIGNSDTAIARSFDCCIYCGGSLDGSKKNHAHLIPELFGRNNTQNTNECNTCNIMSGQWETSVGTFTLPLRVIGKIKGKKGKYPKFKSRLDGYSKESVIYYDSNKVLQCKLATKNDFIPNQDGIGAKLKFRVGGFNPYHVYKAFLKVAISLMNDETLEKERWMIEYLFEREKDDGIFPIMYLYFLSDKIASRPFFQLWQHSANKRNHPKYTLVASFGKSIVQVFLPLKKPTKKIFVQMPPYPKLHGTKSEYLVEKIDLINNSNQHRDWVFNVESNII